jgi:hypothetical protein
MLVFSGSIPNGTKPPLVAEATPSWPLVLLKSKPRLRVPFSVSSTN